MIPGVTMTDPKKAVKVTVLPAGHPLLRNLNLGQQQHVVIRPQQQQQHVVIRPQQQQQVVVQQPQFVVRPQQLVQQQQQPTVYQVRQPGQQQIIIRQQAPSSQLRPPQVVIRSPGVQQQKQQPSITSNGQQFVVKTNNQTQIRLSPGSDGQIKLTPQQLAAITGGATTIHSGQQQFVIKQQQQPLAVRKQAPPQQILVKASHQQQKLTQDSKSILLQRSAVSPIKSVVVTGLVTTKSFTTVAGSTQPVVTYIKQTTSPSPAKAKPGPHIITIKPELLNKKTLVPVPRPQVSKQSLVTSGNVVRLGPGNVVTSLRPALPTEPVPPAIRTLQPVSSSQLLRGLTPVSRGKYIHTGSFILKVRK